MPCSLENFCIIPELYGCITYKGTFCIYNDYGVREYKGVCGAVDVCDLYASFRGMKKYAAQSEIPSGNLVHSQRLD